MKKNIFVRKAAVASLLLAQTIACAWSTNDDVEEGPLVTATRDVQVEICRNFSIQDLGRVAQVSKALNQASNADELWRNRTPDAQTKEDVKNYQTIVAYTSDGLPSIEISGDDVRQFLTKEGFVVNGTIYACQKSRYDSLTPQNKILSFLKNNIRPLNGPSFKLSFRNDGFAYLVNEDFFGYEEIAFMPGEEASDATLIVTPSPILTLSADHEERAKWMLNVLSLLNKKYEESKFDYFWGVGAPFDLLINLSDSFSTFESVSFETKNQIVDFFTQRYAEFRNNASDEDQTYAEAYLKSLNENIKDLKTDIHLPS